MSEATFCSCSGKKKCSRADHCSCKKANIKCGDGCKCLKAICKNFQAAYSNINTTSLVERIQLHPLAAATTLRNHDLVDIFDTLTASDTASKLAPCPASVPVHTSYELQTEDDSHAHIVGMSHHPLLDGTSLPKWCFCGRCRPVINGKGRICCRSTSGACVLLEDSDLRFLVLGSRCVRTALNQARCLRHQDNWEYNAVNLRFQAYQQYIYATIGATGRGNRVPIPACICWAIRDRWPSLSYTGFRESAVNGKPTVKRRTAYEIDENEGENDLEDDE